MEYLVVGVVVVALLLWARRRWKAARVRREKEAAAAVRQAGRSRRRTRARASESARPQPPQRQFGRALFSELSCRDDWVVLDVEATGLGERDQVIEIAVVSPAGAVLLNELVMPAVPISQGASRKHGLTKRRLEGRPDWRAVHDRLEEVVRGKTVVAYNAEYDERLIRQTCAAYGLTMPACRWACCMQAYAAVIGEPHKWRPGEFRWWKLEEALAGEEISAPATHRALADAEATRQLIVKLGRAA